MARLVAFVALCLLFASLAAATSPFLVKGKCYCDTCRCGFETEATKYLAGSKVKIECRNRVTNEITYTIGGVTNSQGEYNILVDRDCGDDVCDVVLVESSDKRCGKPNGGRDRARVILTRNNGMISDVRYANNMGFLSDEPLSACTRILQQYQLTEDQY
ncbi:pollen-specific protein C13 [Nicotiana tabacum]|uniref:Pollen-specific protein C13 n=3 Tax=Nicotiana TaxID=4085 RepID=A0A1S4C3F5_TOBAC|nr:PREDICTED: pollen-specific protein C13-like [Nicotiana sylvestris]XP_016495706.1 PREDICTED: pollen-specific protein C13-like [Nicotiana tabacum]